jgi:hypothetical protein
MGNYILLNQQVGESKNLLTLPPMIGSDDKVITYVTPIIIQHGILPLANNLVFEKDSNPAWLLSFNISFLGCITPLTPAVIVKPVEFIVNILSLTLTSTTPPITWDLSWLTPLGVSFIPTLGSTSAPSNTFAVDSIPGSIYVGLVNLTTKQGVSTNQIESFSVKINSSLGEIGKITIPVCIKPKDKFDERNTSGLNPPAGETTDTYTTKYLSSQTSYQISIQEGSFVGYDFSKPKTNKSKITKVNHVKGLVEYTVTSQYQQQIELSFNSSIIDFKKIDRITFGEYTYLSGTDFTQSEPVISSEDKSKTKVTVTWKTVTQGRPPRPSSGQTISVVYLALKTEKESSVVAFNPTTNTVTLTSSLISFINDTDMQISYDYSYDDSKVIKE